MSLSSIKPILRSAAILVALACGDAARAAESDMPEPYLIVRSVQRLHVQMAQGSTVAQSTHARLIQEVSESFARANPDVWKKPQNVAAAAILLLSGGPSTSIRALLRNGAFPEDSSDLILAALAYAEGRQPEAQARLEEIDLSLYPATLSGQLALAAATLTARSDPAKADEFFSRARLDMPGTLVEETALRRQIFLADERRDLDRFAIYASQYLRRFPKSIYANTMLERFPPAVVRFALSDDPVVREKLDILLMELEPEQRRTIYLDVATAALVKGRLQVASIASARARELSRDGSILARRAEIYQAASTVLGPEREAALEALMKISKDGLTKRDQDLAVAARGLGGFISSWPPRAEGASLAAEPAPTDLMRRAQTVEAGIEALLSEKQK